MLSFIQNDVKVGNVVPDFECAGDEVLVESSPPASPDMAARLAAPAQVYIIKLVFLNCQRTWVTFNQQVMETVINPYSHIIYLTYSSSIRFRALSVMSTWILDCMASSFNC